MWVLIDNYDSFTYILHHYLTAFNEQVLVLKNDETSIEHLIRLKPSRLIISPGPETPATAGITNKAIEYFYNKVPVLGICLGHQAIGILEGAQLERTEKPMHGKVSELFFLQTDHKLVEGIKQPAIVMRYHSLVLRNWKNCRNILPIAISADDSELMAFAHKNLPVVGFQFHPESILTENGRKWLSNWNEYCFKFERINTGS